MGAQALEHALAVAHVDAHRDVRMAGGERLHELGRDVLAGGGHGADAQLPGRAVGHLPCSARALVEQADDIRRVRREDRARGAGPDVAPDALGQLDPELAGESGHRGRHRRLRHDELLRGRSHRAGANDSQEAAQLSDRHSHPPKRSCGR